MDATMNFDMTEADRTEAATKAAHNAAEMAMQWAMAQGVEGANKQDAYDAAYAEAYAGFANDNKDMWAGIQADANEVAWNAVNPN